MNYFHKKYKDLHNEKVLKERYIAQNTLEKIPGCD